MKSWLTKWMFGLVCGIGILAPSSAWGFRPYYYGLAFPGPADTIYVQSQDSVRTSTYVHKFVPRAGHGTYREVWRERLGFGPTTSVSLLDLWVNAQGTAFLVGHGLDITQPEVEQNFLYVIPGARAAKAPRAPYILPGDPEDPGRIRYSRVVGGPDGSLFFVSLPMGSAHKPSREFAVLKVTSALEPDPTFGTDGILVVDGTARFFGNADDFGINSITTDSAGNLLLALDLTATRSGVFQRLGTGVYEISANGKKSAWLSGELAPYPLLNHLPADSVSVLIVPETQTILELSQRGGDRGATVRNIDYRTGEVIPVPEAVAIIGKLGVVDTIYSALEALKRGPGQKHPTFFLRRGPHLIIEKLSPDGRPVTAARGVPPPERLHHGWRWQDFRGVRRVVDWCSEHLRSRSPNREPRSES